MFGLLRKRVGTQGFWPWLVANTARIQSGLKQDPERFADEIGREFKASYPGLVWEISPAAAPPWLFCVSADGRRELFPMVEQAVRAAPELPGWTLQAFRTRGSLTAEIEMAGRKVGYDDIWCRVEPQGGGVRVTLCIRGLSPQSDEALSPAALILLDNAVGEYDSVMKIRQLDRGPLPPDPQRRDEFFPLAELPRFLDGIKAS
jgi:hypothetical protein